MKIFISHSSKDEAIGNSLVQLLKGIGISDDDIVFTSNSSYGIPPSQNIFNWLKSQIKDKPLVIYLLSENYYKSIACLNEMGAAWIIENEHIVIFTSDFNLECKEFQSGVLDPREIGFFVHQKDRILQFIDSLKTSFSVTSKSNLINQEVDRFIINTKDKKTQITLDQANKKRTSISFESNKNESPHNKESSTQTNTSNESKTFSNFLNDIRANNFTEEELILTHYIVDNAKVKLWTGWKSNEEVTSISDWEIIRNIKNIVSSNYERIIGRFQYRKYTEVSEVTSHNNPKAIKIKDEIASNILTLPNDVLEIIQEAVNKNYHKYTKEELESDLPF